jgi:RNA binding exosome subunit
MIEHRKIAVVLHATKQEEAVGDAISEFVAGTLREVQDGSAI